MNSVSWIAVTRDPREPGPIPATERLQQRLAGEGRRQHRYGEQQCAAREIYEDRPAGPSGYTGFRAQRIDRWLR